MRYFHEISKQAILQCRQEEVDELVELCLIEGHLLVPEPNHFFKMKRINKLLPLAQTPDFFDKPYLLLKKLKIF